MSSHGERSDEEDVLELMGVNENQDSDHGSGDELQGDQEQIQELTADDEAAKDAVKKVTPVATKRAKRFMPTLNTALLKGPKGAHTIEKYFEGFKFHEKGREKEDLDRIMKRLEHWSHRLFPKLNFDDCLAKIEHLGNKKDLQVFLKRYRLDMISADDDLTRPEFIDDDKNEEKQEDSAPQEEFDLLLAEQIEKQRQNNTTMDTSAFDNLLASINPPTRKEPEPELTDEIKERIERNRKLALEIKQARLKRLQLSKAAEILDHQKVNEDQSSTHNFSQHVSDSGMISSNEENGTDRMVEVDEENQKLVSQNNSFEKQTEESTTFKENSTSQICDVNSKVMEENILVSSCLNKKHNPMSQKIEEEVDKEQMEEAENNFLQEINDEMMTTNEIEKPTSEQMEEDIEFTLLTE